MLTPAMEDTPQGGADLPNPACDFTLQIMAGNLPNFLETLSSLSYLDSGVLNIKEVPLECKRIGRVKRYTQVLLTNLRSGPHCEIPWPQPRTDEGIKISGPGICM